MGAALVRRLTLASLEGVPVAALRTDAPERAGHVAAERAAAAGRPRALVLVHAARAVRVAVEAGRAQALVAADNVAAQRAGTAGLGVLALVQVHALRGQAHGNEPRNSAAGQFHKLGGTSTRHRGGRPPVPS